MSGEVVGPVATIGAPIAVDMEGDNSNESDLLPWLVRTGLCGLQVITGDPPVTTFLRKHLRLITCDWVVIHRALSKEFSKPLPIRTA